MDVKNMKMDNCSFIIKLRKTVISGLKLCGLWENYRKKKPFLSRNSV
jgi:hypothetical protein